MGAARSPHLWGFPLLKCCNTPLSKSWGGPSHSRGAVRAVAQPTPFCICGCTTDNYDGTNGTSSTSSGIPQQPYAFTKLFAKMDCVGGRGARSQEAGATAPLPLGPLPRQLSGVPKHNYMHNWQLWTDKYPGMQSD